LSTSKLQEATKDRLRILLDGFNSHENYRPDWLTYPETGRRLELDFYMPDVKVGIEVQGAQHDRYTPFFHASEAEFEGQQRRDAFKRTTCQKHGVFLYEVRAIEDIDAFLEAAKDHCGDLYWELYKKQAALKALGYYAARLAQTHHKSHSSGQRKEMADITAKLIHICQKYNIPLKSVRADFYTGKQHMAYVGKKIVKLHWLNEEGKVRNDQKAPVLRTDGDVAVIRLKEGGRLRDVEFSLSTGVCLSQEPGLDGWHIHRFINTEVDSGGQPITASGAKE